ncbi:hypothetical protein SANTM175S_07198 [Streptomyces antimycoticus]
MRGPVDGPEGGLVAFLRGEYRGGDVARVVRLQALFLPRTEKSVVIDSA